MAINTELLTSRDISIAGTPAVEAGGIALEASRKAFEEGFKTGQKILDMPVEARERANKIGKIDAEVELRPGETALKKAQNASGLDLLPGSAALKKAQDAADLALTPSQQAMKQAENERATKIARQDIEIQKLEKAVDAAGGFFSDIYDDDGAVPPFAEAARRANEAIDRAHMFKDAEIDVKLAQADIARNNSNSTLDDTQRAAFATKYQAKLEEAQARVKKYRGSLRYAAKRDAAEAAETERTKPGARLAEGTAAPRATFGAPTPPPAAFVPISGVNAPLVAPATPQPTATAVPLPAGTADTATAVPIPAPPVASSISIEETTSRSQADALFAAANAAEQELSKLDPRLPKGWSPTLGENSPAQIEAMRKQAANLAAHAAKLQSQRAGRDQQAQAGANLQAERAAIPGAPLPAGNMVTPLPPAPTPGVPVVEPAEIETQVAAVHQDAADAVANIPFPQSKYPNLTDAQIYANGAYQKQLEKEDEAKAKELLKQQPTPAQLEKRMADFDEALILFGQLKAAQSVVGKPIRDPKTGAATGIEPKTGQNVNVVGGVAGSYPVVELRKLGLGTQETIDAQAKMDQLAKRMNLNMTTILKGAISQKEMAVAAGAQPTMRSTETRWADWLDASAIPAAERAIRRQAESLAKWGDDYQKGQARNFLGMTGEGTSPSGEPQAVAPAGYDQATFMSLPVANTEAERAKVKDGHPFRYVNTRTGLWTFRTKQPMLTPDDLKVEPRKR